MARDVSIRGAAASRKRGRAGASRQAEVSRAWLNQA